MKRMRGFTLIELMVSLTLGMIVLGAVVAVYVNSKRTFNVVSQRISMQQDARIALLQISRDLRMAGSYGCATLDANNTTASQAVTVSVANDVLSPGTNQTFIMDGSSYVPFKAYASGTASTWLGGQTASSPVDVLAVQYGRGSAVAASGAASFSANSNMQRTYTVGQHFYVASTCQNVVLHYTSAGLASAGVSVTLGSMTSGADLMDLVSRAYFVNSSGALVMSELGQSDTLGQSPSVSELMSNVTAMQYEYGEITDSTNCLVTYRSRASVGNWRNVSSVRITLTVRSQNQVPLASGNSFGYLTQTYQTTAAIRGKQCYRAS